MQSPDYLCSKIFFGPELLVATDYQKRNELTFARFALWMGVENANNLRLNMVEFKNKAQFDITIEVMDRLSGGMGRYIAKYATYVNLDGLLVCFFCKLGSIVIDVLRIYISYQFCSQHSQTRLFPVRVYHLQVHEADRVPFL